VLYFILNGFLTLWIWRFEGGKVFVGVREGQQKVGSATLGSLICADSTTQLTLQSSVKKHIPVYKLRVCYEAPSGKRWEDKEIEGRFAKWFNEAGYLQHAELKQWLAKNVEVIGKADPQSKNKGEERNSAGTAVEAPQSSGLETPSNAKGTRRTKRKA
jgi:Microsomal signal peptidase 25 kDa subunit (SPC25)